MKPKRAGKLTWLDALGVATLLVALMMGIPQKSASRAALPDASRSAIQVALDP